MTVLLALAVAAAVYGWGLMRVARAGRPFSRVAPLAFGAGLLAIGAALCGPVDALADASLSWHMGQHLILISLAAPLLIFGAPVRLALAALPPRGAARLAHVLGSAPMHTIDHPLFGLALLTLVLFGTHFSPLYERALENETVHAAEHALFLTAALLFWMPIFAVAPAPHARSHPLRILALFLSLPAGAFLGFAFYVTNRVLYPHYAARPDALADQMNAGAVMWLSAGTPVLLALLWCVADWGARERRLGAVFDAAQEQEALP
ncbi:MAG TPA: cytochrome c oxidase assembly protein [Candidatus Elarobacter sp.]|jgi:cytochrome c oxidase assembly factor CtaG|nr:cytochrome c oxidase assembly protein [Candidatus Elarobacter sp.]